jgi:catechol 2,3-dioxygenase-like lactoylglutathione lyase family enzyme
MFALLSLMAVSTLPTVGIAQSAPEPPYIGSYYKRQAIAVSDMARALTLYRDILGFQLKGGVNTAAADSYTPLVMNVPPNARVRTAALDAGTVQIRTVLLVEITGVPLPSAEGIRTAAAVINANGRFEEIVQAVKAAGLPTLPTHREGDPSRPADMGIEMAFSDWDGNRILIYEFPNDRSAPSRR